MHVLGHSFSQRRKSPKPRDLHIRKVSFSGCSLSSGGSLSSSSSSSSSAASTSTTRAPLSSRTTASFDPLSLHPTFQPPPRLHDRPLLSPERRQFEAAATFFDDDDESDDGYFAGAGEYGCQGKEELPPHASPMDHTGHDRTEPQDYFFQQITKRPQLPRSRWSESTVHTLEQLTPAASVMSPDGDDDGDDGGYPFQQPSHSSMPNFSYKRATALPKRPPMKTLDSLDEFIKRGGWKRRGIVFHEEDMSGDGAAF